MFNISVGFTVLESRIALLQIATRSHAWEPRLRDSFMKFQHAADVGSGNVHGFSKHSGYSTVRAIDEGTAAWLVRVILVRFACFACNNR